MSDAVGDSKPLGARILVAEDEAIIALALAAELKERGLAVELAGNGAVALDLFLTRGPFDALVTDMKMPRMGGDELIMRLWERCPDLPVVIMTADMSPEALRLLVSAGGSFVVLSKPTSFNTVGRAVEYALSRRPDLLSVQPRE